MPQQQLIAALALMPLSAGAATYRLGTLEAGQPWSRPAVAGTNGVGYDTTTTPVNCRSTKKCPGLFAEIACRALALYSTANPNATSTAVTNSRARASSDMRQRSRVPVMVPLITRLTRSGPRVARTHDRALRNC